MSASAAPFVLLSMTCFFLIPCADYVEYIISVEFHPPVQVLLNVEGVFFVVVCCVLVVRMLCQVIFIRTERPDTAKLEDALLYFLYCLTAKCFGFFFSRFSNF